VTQENKETLKKANAAISQGDNEGFLSFCADDLAWTMVGDTTLNGKPAVREWMATAYKEPPRFAVTDLIAENDFVTALGDISLENEDGKAEHYAYCDVWRFRDGKMVELRAFVVRKPGHE